MKKVKLIIILSWLPFLLLQAQEISVSYNYSAVQKLVEILDSGKLTEKDFTELIELQASKAYLKKMSTFFSGINELSFKESLEAAAKGAPMENDLFMFDRILPAIPSVRELLSEVILKEEEITLKSVSLLSQYCPHQIEMEVTVYMVIGVTGGGWTFDDDPNSFYVDFRSMKEDLNGLTYLSAHELFHLIQYRFMQDTPSKSDKVAFLLDQMVREGSATYVADFTKIDNEGSYVEFNKRDYERNFRRMKSNFALFETLIFQAKYDSSSNLDLLYDIGLSGMYQSPMYYVGYHMMKLIEQYSGRQELITLLKQSPDKLISSYNRLCQLHQNDDSNFIPLSVSTMKILDSSNE